MNWEAGSQQQVLVKQFLFLLTSLLDGVLSDSRF